MTTRPKRIEDLTAADLESHPVWMFASDTDGDETCVLPVSRVPVADPSGKLVATQVTLANGSRRWALISNIDPASARLTTHFLTVSIEQTGQWFNLARYHDFDFENRSPKALARFLGLRLDEVFPISYDVGANVRGGPDITTGTISESPAERLSRAELIARAIPRRFP